MTEGATFPHHPEFLTPINPWKSDIWAGASSSGSGVATAAGLCFGSLGSDTGGSIRLPCAANNLSGLKPTWGRVSRHGVFPMIEPLDTVGPMARSVADVAAIFDAIAGYDPLDPTSIRSEPDGCLRGLEGASGLSGVVIGVDREFNDDECDHEVTKLIDEAIRTFAKAGAEVRHVNFPQVRELRVLAQAYGDAHLLASHEQQFAEHPEQYGDLLRRRLEAARSIKPALIARAEIEKRKFHGRMEELFREIDALLTPVLSIATPHLDDLKENPIVDMPWMFKFSGIMNYAGGAILSLPCGFLRDGSPVGFQLVGAERSEIKLFKAGHAYQQVTDWHTRHPASCP